ncbi:raffinose/stachyose/melibiose transport system permease protein [Paenibacillus sp. UNC496MF]|uniref:carbohydrate ABC transporter permease n=1 Tax=Paenibacillus sp. UNC496MF TaxID=1502753 RepID=UPI0008E7C227|nr:sugar ABC transporter permease [Paenibacillus sp. UNC496MF]SFJ41489.1 raffinose/stachyose/melibiose transport system permease protein [Paenibacillus sp. UNC496MF]
MRLERKQYWIACLFLLPALAIFGLFFYYPFLQSIYYSFTQWNGLKAPAFIGFDNYRYIFSDQQMLDGMKNTLKMVVFGLVVQNPLALLLALLLNRKFRTRAFLRTSFYLPIIVSLVVTSIIWGELLKYDGFLNGLLKPIIGEAHLQDWLGTVYTSFPTIILLTQWQGIGYCALIYLAGLQSIPPDIYEAADIEGAKGFALFRHVTFPMLMPSVTIVLFLTIVGALRLFDLPYLLTNGGPGTSSYTLFLAVYNAAFKAQNYGYATAAGILLAIFIIIVTVVQLAITRRREVEL